MKKAIWAGLYGFGGLGYIGMGVEAWRGELAPFWQAGLCGTVAVILLCFAWEELT